MSSYRARRERRIYRARAVAAVEALRDILQDAAGARVDHYGFYTGQSVVITEKHKERLREIARPVLP